MSVYSFTWLLCAVQSGSGNTDGSSTGVSLTTLFPFFGDFLDADFLTERKLTDERFFAGFRVAGMVVIVG